MYSLRLWFVYIVVVIVYRLIEFIDEKMFEDGLVVIFDKKKNLWVENRKCVIL